MQSKRVRASAPSCGRGACTPTSNRQEADERNPDDLVWKRMLIPEVGEVINESYCACRNQNEADDGHREGTFIHESRAGASLQCKIQEKQCSHVYWALGIVFDLRATRRRSHSAAKVAS